MNLMPNCCRKCGEEMRYVASADIGIFLASQRFCANDKCEFSGVMIQAYLPAEGGKQTQDLERL